jgi:predicted metal-dependent HD superfamily phosphohydrolase
VFETDFKDVCTRMGLPSEGFFEDLRGRYAEPGRHYHNASHIRVVLDRINVLAEGLEGISDADLDVIRFAAFYHDAVYVPGFSENEQLSAYMAESHLLAMGNKDVSLVDRVSYIILATKKHHPWSTADALLVDADLYGLGTNDYWKNGAQVRAEFADIEPEDFLNGRIGFLKSFLARDRIFTIPGQDDVEALARSNMQEELDELVANT